jgi:hypothetical protein
MLLNIFRLSMRNLGRHPGKNAFVAILQADKPLWEKDTATTGAHLHCAGNSHDVSIANNGSAPAKPVITVKFNAAKTDGPLYYRNRCFPNICTNALKDPDGEGYPTLVKSGLDTAALVTAGKALASGNDFLVWVDGVKVDRWFGTGSTAWNQATTNVWANIPWVARRFSQTVAAMTTGDPPSVTDSIEFTTDISTWPAAGYFYTLTNQEVIFYGSHIGKTAYGIKRGQKGTTAQTHSAATFCLVPVK